MSDNSLTRISSTNDEDEIIESLTQTEDQKFSFRHGSACRRPDWTVHNLPMRTKPHDGHHWNSSVFPTLFSRIDPVDPGWNYSNDKWPHADEIRDKILPNLHVDHETIPSRSKIQRRQKNRRFLHMRTMRTKISSHGLNDIKVVRG